MIFQAFYAVAVVGALQQARIEQEAFVDSLKGLPSEEQQRQIECRSDRLDADRRTREISDAIKASRPRGFGVFW